MQKHDQLAKDFHRLSATERRAVLDFSDRIKHTKRLDTRQTRVVVDGIAEIVRAIVRTKSKRESDAAADKERRITIGARVPREDAQRYRDAATETGRSMYRFAVDAFEREYSACKNRTDVLSSGQGVKL